MSERLQQQEATVRSTLETTAHYEKSLLQLQLQASLLRSLLLIEKPGFSVKFLFNLIVQLHLNNVSSEKTH